MNVYLHPHEYSEKATRDRQLNGNNERKVSLSKGVVVCRKWGRSVHSLLNMGVVLEHVLNGSGWLQIDTTTWILGQVTLLRNKGM